MPEVFIFADEAGNLDFSPKASRYFILTTVTLPDLSAGDALLGLRRKLAWEGLNTHPDFRASEEEQAVRDRVYDLLRTLKFRIDATVFDKPKLWPPNRTPETGFYRFAWFYHFKYLAKQAIPPDARLMVVPATLGERKQKQEAFADAVRRVVEQHAKVDTVRVAFWRARSDPCLWLADYCCWAIQRKWEYLWKGSPDRRSYSLISGNLSSEFDIFQGGKKLFYELPEKRTGGS
jgi:hypothetical protein